MGKGGEKGTEEAAKVGRAFHKTRRRRAGRPEEVWRTVDPVEECEEVEWREAEEEAQDVARMLKTRSGGGEANRGGRRRGVVDRLVEGGLVVPPPEVWHQAESPKTSHCRIRRRKPRIGLLRNRAVYKCRQRAGQL